MRGSTKLEPSGVSGDRRAPPPRGNFLLRILTVSALLPPFNPQRRNVRDSDATLIISHTAELSGGTELTQRFVAQHNKPLLLLVYERGFVPLAAKKLRRFIEQHDVRVLNVAGPRESDGGKKVMDFTSMVLEAAFVER